MLERNSNRALSMRGIRLDDLGGACRRSCCRPRPYRVRARDDEHFADTISENPMTATTH